MVVVVVMHAVCCVLCYTREGEYMEDVCMKYVGGGVKGCDMTVQDMTGQDRTG